MQNETITVQHIDFQSCLSRGNRSTWKMSSQTSSWL